MARGRAPYDGTMEQPIVFWPTERDEENLALLAAAGLDGETAIRAALSTLASECTPAVYALSAASTAA